MFKQLIENSIEAIHSSRVEERSLEIMTSFDAGFVTIEILDSGPGVPKNLAVKVFEPFFSTKEDNQSFRGMGLTMVHEIVNDHAGMVTLGSRTKSGCRVTIQLPISTDTVES